jgi:hypothetical protein
MAALRNVARWQVFKLRRKGEIRIPWVEALVIVAAWDGCSTTTGGQNLARWGSLPACPGWATLSQTSVRT